MRIVIDVDKDMLLKILAQYIQTRFGDCIIVDPKSIHFEVKTRDNYKAEWENGFFRGRYEAHV